MPYYDPSIRVTNVRNGWRWLQPADETAVVPDEIEGGDFGDMAAEYVHGLGREIVWVGEATCTTLNNTHRIVDGFK